MALKCIENKHQNVNMPMIAETKFDEQQPQITLEPVVLELGDEGPNVAFLQAKLNVFDYYQGEINGQFDLLTQQSLKQYQSDNELNEMGYFGAETWYSVTFWKKEEDLPFVSGLLSKFVSLGVLASRSCNLLSTVCS